MTLFHQFMRALKQLHHDDDFSEGSIRFFDIDSFHLMFRFRRFDDLHAGHFSSRKNIKEIG